MARRAALLGMLSCTIKGMIKLYGYKKYKGKEIVLPFHDRIPFNPEEFMAEYQKLFLSRGEGSTIWGCSHAISRHAAQNKGGSNAWE